MDEKKEYLGRQLITYLGNKRALLDFIGEGIEKVRRRTGKARLKIFDVFSGSGIVARYCKRFSELLVVNDLERYSAAINGCYLSNESEIDLALLRECHGELVGRAGRGLTRGIISELYAPSDSENINPGERVFYTARNAMYIDTIRQAIDELPAGARKYFLAPLLSEASIHVNTAGVFKGFYKNKSTGVGQFGGKSRNALERITGNIELPFPVFSNFDCETVICNGDANRIIGTVPEVDLAYLDPPYNQHPYGSNYFMLNVIHDYRFPEKISQVSGIPENWNRSDYNKGNKALESLTELVANIKAKYVLVSFNSEGFIDIGRMKEMLGKIGSVETLETRYNAFRGSRNLSGRGIYVKEYLFLLEK
ncbi:MAG: DNA adenine methylase [Treponema sp.]|nr:DNA adenine methylase [Treponema sp.]